MSTTEAVEAQAAGDDDEPSLGVVEAGDVGARQAAERFLHNVLGVAEISDDAERQSEHPRPMRPPECCEHRVIDAAGVGSFHGKRHRDTAGSGRAAVHPFFLRPSCQINFSIDGLAAVVATAIVDRTCRSLTAWRSRQSARSMRAVNR